MERSRVAVIGAGCCGLAAIKSCLDEGLDPVCYEQTCNVGGLWNYTEDVQPGRGSVAMTTFTNTSKAMVAFSDFPMPKEWPNYLHHTKMLHYFRMYIERFNLKKYIRFNIQVKMISRSEDFDVSGKWNIETTDRNTGVTSTETFDAVMICAGHNREKYVPHFTGEYVFKGELIHSHEYRNPQLFAEKKVVIIGFGDSACDAAVDLSRVSKQVYLSTRSGGWVMSRVGKGGLPFDMAVINRALMGLTTCTPKFVHNHIAENILNNTFDHTLYSLRPSSVIDLDNNRITINGELIGRILNGTVILKNDIEEFTETGVTFTDGTQVDDVDTIIMATGYKFDFPFLEEGIIKMDEESIDLYKLIFPPHLKHSTLACIGYCGVSGPVSVIAEIQTRWAARVFTGLSKLPNAQQMQANIKQWHQLKKKTLHNLNLSKYILVEYIPYFDMIAEEVGCKPNIGRLLLTDPRLAFQVIFGPCCSAQYRLHGPGSWLGARETVLSVWENMAYPLQSRACYTKKSHWKTLVVYCTVVIGIVAWVFNLC